ncbi:hypothetical protein [Nocardioides acrostichi]|uniref:ARB-07466-like C-terminal domain-containing protein n=1 Tax=Nocardioides acrostichi TaxID=2784339 RepID=A0A930YCF0_9ACTN|nr:hypothetical protein [Nocardioides acrostichi]MBF4163418.1 hypothetical protein [Nocardioides acrostichi]
MAYLRHKRDTDARPSSSNETGTTGPLARRPRRSTLAAASVAVLATAGVVAVGVGTHLPGSDASVTTAADLRSVATASGSTRDAVVSRSGDRLADAPVVDGESLRPKTAVELATSPRLTKKAIAAADTHRFTTATLNLWTTPGERADKTGELKSGKKVLITGREAGGRDEVVIDGASRWVTHGYLSADKPDPAEQSLGGACTNGTTADSGVAPNTAKVHEAVCAAFPDISTYGYFRGGETDHATGHAVDIMVSGSEGWAIADFVRAHASELGVSYVIYSQHIWSVQRSSEGWRGMEDRGSTTANHYDHVHVSVY